MAPRLRARPSLKLPGRNIRKKSTSRFPGFPDIKECWEQSREHQRYFLQYLNCNQRKDYHDHVNACKPFDDMIERWASVPFKRTFFLHYTIVGRVPRSTDYLDGLVHDRRLLQRYSACSLRKRLTSSYRNAALIPPILGDWPLNFNLFDLFLSDNEREEVLESVEMCIERRIVFRNACVKACCTKSDTTTHDQFLLILQILRAQLLVE